MGLIGLEPGVEAQLMQFRKPIMDALTEAASRVEKNLADAACTRWFGDATPAFKKELALKLRKLRSNIHIRNIRVGFETLRNRSRNTNAASYRGDALDFGVTLPGTGQDDNMNLDRGFMDPTLPKYLPLAGGVVDASFYSQSKFETLIHELSHLLLNTKDVVVGVDSDGDDKEAYGAKRARKLATNDPAKAKKNAENWGIFVEAVGIHKAS